MALITSLDLRDPGITVSSDFNNRYSVEPFPTVPPFFTSNYHKIYTVSSSFVREFVGLTIDCAKEFTCKRSAINQPIGVDRSEVSSGEVINAYTAIKSVSNSISEDVRQVGSYKITETIETNITFRDGGTGVGALILSVIASTSTTKTVKVSLPNNRFGNMFAVSNPMYSEYTSDIKELKTLNTQYIVVTESVPFMLLSYGYCDSYYTTPTFTIIT